VTLQDYVAEYIDKPAGELTIEQIKKLLELRKTEAKQARFLQFVPDKNSYEWRRGYDDAMIDQVWTSVGHDTENELWNYNAGFNEATSEKGRKKVGF
jgi:hypothetical protein